MSDRQRLGGASTLPAASRDTQRDSLSGDFTFPRSEFSQTVIDVATIIFCSLFVTVTGLGIAFALFILFFVRL